MISVNFSNILFLDIETVPQKEHYADLEEIDKELWDKKSNQFYNTDQDSEALYNRAGIYAEFGKIVCVSTGFFPNKESFRIKSFYGDDEKELLSQFSDLLNSYFNLPAHLLCAHNGKEFDFPYLARRLLINKLPLPDILNSAGKKPWEIRHLDTMELWKFGDYKSYTPLNLLARVFNIPSPKDDINGSEVAAVYFKEKNLERIARYCEKDTITVANLLLSFQGANILREDQITYA